MIRRLLLFVLWPVAAAAVTLATEGCSGNCTTSLNVLLQQQWSSTLSAPLGDRHQLLCSTYDDEIWRQSFLCGQASRVEQFASGSSSRGQSTLLNADSNCTFLACVLMIDSVMPSGPVSRMEGTKLALLTYLLTYLLLLLYWRAPQWSVAVLTTRCQTSLSLAFLQAVWTPKMLRQKYKVCCKDARR